MPPKLVKAHNEMDKVVDLAYKPQPFSREDNRIEFLFGIYEKRMTDLLTNKTTNMSKIVLVTNK